jgi:hypothetical protein
VKFSPGADGTFTLSGRHSSTLMLKFSLFIFVLGHTKTGGCIRGLLNSENREILEFRGRFNVRAKREYVENAFGRFPGRNRWRR